MDNLIQMGSSGGVGGLIGGFLSFLGLKHRVESIDKRLDRLNNSVVFTDGCNATVKDLSHQLQNQKEMLTEIRDDVKSILKES